LRYCELGCGRGYGTVLLAAANPDIEFVGVDFNPAHVGEARGLASAAGISNATFLELSFADAARSSDPRLAGVDIVALHGVFSWVGRDIRADIVAFLAAKLAPGGLAYVSYNTLPGWAAAAPIQRLFKEYADRAAGDSLAKIAGGRAALKTLADKSAGYVAQNPLARQRLQAMARQDPHYLVHEFLHESWEPIYVTDAFAALAEAKLTYAGSANIAENRLMLCVAKDLIELVESAPDAALRELLKDYAVNKQFRRDVYVKGPRRLSGEKARKRYKELVFALTALPEPLPEKWRIPSGEAKLKEGAAEAIVSRLRDGPADAAELAAAAAKAGLGRKEVPAALEILIHNAIVAPCRADFATVDRAAGQRLNQALLDFAPAGDTHRFLAAPALGSAIGSTYLQRLAALVLRQHQEADDDALAGHVFDRVTAAGKGFFRDGKPIERNAQSVKELAGLIGEFRKSALPRWRALGVVD
jgi:hypothetical protein